MPASEQRIEIYDVGGSGDVASMFLLVHVEEVPDDEATYRAVVVRLRAGGGTVEYRLPTWSPSMWCSPSGVVYVAGMDGQIHSNPGATWQTSVLSNRHTLATVWGLSDQDIYCSGPSAQFYRKRGEHWEAFNAGLEGDLYGMGGTASDDLYVLGDRGRLFHTDGGPWREVESPTNVNLVDVLCVSPQEVYFCGWKGKFFRLANGRWDDLSLGNSDNNLYRMARLQDRLYVASSVEGLLWFDGQHLVPFAPRAPSIGVRVIRDRLFAFRDTRLQWFHETAWREVHIDLDRLINSSQPGASA